MEYALEKSGQLTYLPIESPLRKSREYVYFTEQISFEKNTFPILSDKSGAIYEWTFQYFCLFYPATLFMIQI